MSARTATARWALAAVGPACAAGVAFGFGEGNLAIAYIVGGTCTCVGVWANLLPRDLRNGKARERDGVVEPLPEGFRLKVREYGSEFVATVCRIPTPEELDREQRIVRLGFGPGFYDRYEMGRERGRTADTAAQKAIREFHRARAQKAECEIAEMVHNPSGGVL